MIIGTDLVSIRVTNRNGFLDFRNDGSLAISPGGEYLVLPFSRFDGGFQIGENDALVNDKQGDGDRWELA